MTWCQVGWRIGTDLIDRIQKMQNKIPGQSHGGKNPEQGEQQQLAITTPQYVQVGVPPVTDDCRRLDPSENLHLDHPLSVVAVPRCNSRSLWDVDLGPQTN